VAILAVLGEGGLKPKEWSTSMGIFQCKQMHGTICTSGELFLLARVDADRGE
jgi:hypothetical protein